jgi:hypothetical protein
MKTYIPISINCEYLVYNALKQYSIETCKSFEECVERCEYFNIREEIKNKHYYVVFEKDKYVVKLFGTKEKVFEYEVLCKARKLQNALNGRSNQQLLEVGGIYLNNRIIIQVEIDGNNISLLTLNSQKEKRIYNLTLKF